MKTYIDAITGELMAKDGGRKVSLQGAAGHIEILEGDTRYDFQTPLESLAVDAVEDSPLGSELFFRTSDTGIMVTLPATLDVAGELSFEPNCRYAMTFRNNVLRCTALASAAEEALYTATPHNLTSNTSDPRYTLSSSGTPWEEYEDNDGDWHEICHYAWNAMDSQTEGTSSGASCGDGMTWWKIRFNEGFVELHSVSVEDATAKLRLEGSLDDVTYESIAAIPIGTAKVRIHASPYRYYRLVNQNSASTSEFSFGEVEFKYRTVTDFLRITDQTLKYTAYTTMLPVAAFGTGVTYSASGLPDGLAIDAATGVVSGTFPAGGTFVFDVTVTNGAGVSRTAHITASCFDVTTDDITAFEVEIPEAGKKLTIPAIRGGVNILWGDGSETVSGDGGTSGYAHVYGAPGTYKVVLGGSYNGLALGMWIASGDHAGNYITAIHKVSDRLSDAISWANPMFGGLFRIRTVPYFNTSSFTCFEHMFLGCSALETLPAFNTSRVTSFKQVCDGAVSLAALPAWDYSKSTSFDRSFQRCGSMTGTARAADFWGNSRVGNHGGCFSGCTRLANYADIPSSWK